MPKISVSIPEDILEFIELYGKNRSKFIVTILKEYKKRKEEEELARAYGEYEKFCKENENDWHNDWEVTSLKDIGKGL